MHDDDGQNYLANAVDRLARERKMRQETDRGTGIVCVGEYTAPPLLAELRDGIAGNIGSHAGSSMKAKIPLDAGALDLFNEIEAEIIAWTVQAGAELAPLLELTLIRWQIAFARRRGRPTYSDALEAERTATLERWARQIEAMFNPVRTLELTRPGTRTVLDHEGQPVLHKRGPHKGQPVLRDALVPEECPVCGQGYGLVPKTGDRLTALVVEYRTTHEEAVEDVIARCRSCEHVWKGVQGVRALRWDLDQRAAA